MYYAINISGEKYKSEGESCASLKSYSLKNLTEYLSLINLTLGISYPCLD